MAERFYFNERTVRDAITVLARTRYPYLQLNPSKERLFTYDFDGYVGVLRGPKHTKSYDAECTARFVGTLNTDNIFDQTQWRIGDAGKIRALLCFRPEFRTKANENETPEDLCLTILDLRSPNAEAEGLRVMMSTSKQNRTDKRATLLDAAPGSVDARLLGRVIAFVARGLESKAKAAEQSSEHTSVDFLEAQIESVLASGHPTPADCARALCDALGFKPPTDEDATYPLPQSWLEGYMSDYVEAEVSDPLEIDETELGQTVDAVKRILCNPTGKSGAERVVVLRGPEESGKKAVVGDFLRLFKKTVGYELPLFNRKEDRIGTLPILVVSLRLRDYRSLGHHVLALLRRRAGRHHPVERATDAKHAKELAERAFKQCLLGVKLEFGESVPLDALFKEIERAHFSYPSLFVFLDANDLSRGSRSRVLHQKGLLRLLTALRGSEKASRFLITTSELHNVDGLAAGTFREFSVDMPPLKRMEWYFNTTHGQAAFSELQLQLKSKMGRLVPGDILAVCAAMADLGCGKDELHSMIEGCLKLLPKRNNDAPAVKRNDPYYEKASLFIYRKYADVLAERGCLRAVALIAAAAYSRDTLMHTSLLRMHQRLRQSLPTPGQRSNELPITELDAVTNAAKSMVVRRIAAAIPDVEELGVVELKEASLPHDVQKKPNSGPLRKPQATDKSWEVALTSAIWLLRAMKDPPERVIGLDGNSPENYAVVAKSACREVARGARRRAQNKRLRKSDPDIPASRHEIARDIQCLEALLASMPEDMGANIQPPKPHEPPPWLKSNPVFAISDEFRADIAFKFAYHVLLRSDIDAKHQLSMRFDFDTTRLRCYLSLLVGLGELQTWTVEDLRTPGTQVPDILPDEISEYVLYALGPVELHRLLLTIAISAFHCQLPNVVLWSWLQARKLFLPEEESWQSGVDSHGRHIATMLDASIQLGRPLQNHEGTLLDVLELASDMSDDFEKTALSGDADAKDDESELTSEPTPNSAMNVSSTNDPVIAGMVPVLPLTRPGMRIALRRAELLAYTDESPDRALELLGALVKAERLRLKAAFQDKAVLISGRSGRQCARLLLLNFPISIHAPKPNSTLLRSGLPLEKVKSGLDMIDLVVETNLSRMSHNAGMDRIGIVADLVRTHSMRWLFISDSEEDLQHALGYLDLMNEQESSSSISEGARLELTILRAATNWLMSWTDHFAKDSRQSRAAERLTTVKQDIDLAMSISKRIGFEKTCVDLLILNARHDWLKNAVEAKMTESELEGFTALEFLQKADEKAETIEYRAARPIIREWRAWITGLQG